MDPLEEMHYEYKINVLDETDRKYYEDNFLNQHKEDTRSYSSGDFSNSSNSDKSCTSDDSKASSCG